MTVVGRLDARTVSGSAEFKSFLLSMCIAAPKSTTNTLSSGSNLDGARTHQPSEDAKNVASFCHVPKSVYRIWERRNSTREDAMAESAYPSLACDNNYTVYRSGMTESGRGSWAHGHKPSAPGRSDDGKPQDRLPELFLHLFLNKKQWSCSHTPTKG